MTLFELEGEYDLPLEYFGPELKNTGLTKNNPRKWTKEEVDWLLMLKEKGFSNKQIAK